MDRVSQLEADYADLKVRVDSLEQKASSGLVPPKTPTENASSDPLNTPVPIGGVPSFAPPTSSPE